MFGMIKEAVSNGARYAQACRVTGITHWTFQRWCCDGQLKPDVIDIIIAGKLRDVNARLQGLLNQATLKYLRKVGASLLFVKKSGSLRRSFTPLFTVFPG